MSEKELLQLEEFKKKYLTPEEMEFLKLHPLPSSTDSKSRAFINLALDAAIQKVVKKKEAA